jgi:hypothetical protein
MTSRAICATGNLRLLQVVCFRFNFNFNGMLASPGPHIPVKSLRLGNAVEAGQSEAIG